jgi:hypothetical protein
MPVKFNVGFTISGETLFALIAKFLPVDDLHVEEVPPLAKLKVEKIARLEGPKNRPKPKRAWGNRYRGASLDGGANAVVMSLLSDGKPHAASELKPLFEAAGYAPSGVGSRLDKLRDRDTIHQPSYGLWQIGEAKKKAASG